MYVGWHTLPGGEPPTTDKPLGAVTFLDNAPTAAMRVAERMCRPFVTGKPQYQEMQQKASTWHQQGCRVQILNEPNNPPEHFEDGPDAYADYFMRIAANLPGVRCYYAGMSPSANWQTWYTGSKARQVIDTWAAGLVVHAYGNFQQMVDIVQFIARSFPTKPLWIGECNFGAGQEVDRNIWATQVFKPFLDYCASIPTIEAVTYFAYKWATPDMPLLTPVDGVGTAIQTVLEAWESPVSEVKPVLSKNPWASKLLTVWNLPTRPDTLIEIGNDLGLDGFEIKVADGNSEWGANRHVTPDYIKELKLAEYKVLGWVYSYCDGKRDAGDRGDGIPDEEANAAVHAVLELGMEGLTFDFEIECEGHPDEVGTLLSRARAILPEGFPLAAHTWADLDGHGGYPAKIIHDGVDVLRPMIYRPVWNAQKCWLSWNKMYTDRPVCPVWGITQGLFAEIVIDQTFADAHGSVGESYWELAAVANLSAPVKGLIRERAFETISPAQVFNIVSVRQHLWDLATNLEKENHPWLAAGLKSVVALSKGER
jgi:hypothetical protein